MLPSKKNRTGFTEDLREGFVEINKQKGVLWLVFITMIVLFFVGLLQSLIVPMILSLSDARNTGIIQSISASGMIAGSLVIELFGSRKDHVRMLSISLFVAGIFFAFMGSSTNLLLITIAGFLLF